MGISNEQLLAAEQWSQLNKGSQLIKESGILNGHIVSSEQGVKDLK